MNNACVSVLFSQLPCSRQTLGRQKASRRLSHRLGHDTQSTADTRGFRHRRPGRAVYLNSFLTRGSILGGEPAGAELYWRFGFLIACWSHTFSLMVFMVAN